MPRTLSTLTPEKPLILCVDDEESNLLLLENILQNDYQIILASDATSAIIQAETHHPDLIMLDILLPGTDGFEIAKALKSIEKVKNIPIIFVTALEDELHEEKGFELGASDYISKPYNPKIILARVKTQISLVQKNELIDIQFDLMNRFAMALEYKEQELACHIIRLQKFTEIIANKIDLEESSKEALLKVIPIYDMGKIYLNDSILLKPTKLESNEQEEVMKHTFFAKHIIGEYNAPIIKLASSIAYTHHEHWDGTGYPEKLKGEEIPLEGRIVGLIDVFDSLNRNTAYREKWHVDKAFDYIQSESGKKFDPELVQAFLSAKDDIIEVMNLW